MLPVLDAWELHKQCVLQVFLVDKFILSIMMRYSEIPREFSSDSLKFPDEVSLFGRDAIICLIRLIFLFSWATIKSIAAFVTNHH